MSEMAKLTPQETGRKGGVIRKAGRPRGAPLLDSEGYSRLGRKGGQSTAARHGPEFYSEIGRKGGMTCLERHGREHFVAIGKKAGRRVRALVELGRQMEERGG